MTTNTPHPRGSIYVTTLITVAAIATTILVGVNIRSASNTKSALTTQMSKSNQGILNATELALQVIGADPDWKANAQSGIVYSKIDNGFGIMSSTVTDAETEKTPTAATTMYRVKVSSQDQLVYQSAQVDVLVSGVDYTQYLADLGATSYWPLNEVSPATQAIDHLSTNNGNYKDLSIVGSARNDEGAPVPVFKDNTDHIRIGWSEEFEPNDGTISLWLKYDGTNYVSTASPFLGMLHNAGENPTINMAVYDSSIWVYLVNSTQYDIKYALNSSSGSILAGQWYHVVLSWGSNGLTIYIDGAQVARNTSNTDDVKSSDEKPLFIGKGFNMFDSRMPAVGFTGSVAHVAYITGQLNSTQVRQLAEIKPDLPSEMRIIDDSWVTHFE